MLLSLPEAGFMVKGRAPYSACRQLCGQMEAVYSLWVTLLVLLVSEVLKLTVLK